MKRIFIAFLCLTFLSGCFKTSEKEDGFTIYTSFYGMSNLAKMIAGEKATVKVLIPEGVEAHDWEPGTGDMISLNDADVFIYNGMGMEPWVDSILNAVDNSNVNIVKASEGIEKNEGDPHVWLNPQNALIEMENIASALIKADSKNKDYYLKNLENVRLKINELDNSFKGVTDTISDKEIIVTHGAFGYLCAAYGLKQYEIEGINGESDPSTATIREIIDYMNNNNKKALFYISSEDDKVAKTISNETGAKIYSLHTFESGCDNKDYFEIMNENLQTIKKALE